MLHALLILFTFSLQPLECKLHKEKEFYLLFIVVSSPIVTGPGSWCFVNIIEWRRIGWKWEGEEDAKDDSQVPGLCKWMVYGSMSENKDKAWGLKS